MSQTTNSSGEVTRRSWLQTVPAALAPLAAAPAQTAARGERPNIILLISDQFRWDCIGAMGLNPMNLTPNLDAMAGRGVLFRQCDFESAGMRPGARQHFHGTVSRAGTACGERFRPGCGGATTLATVAAAGRLLGELHRQVAPGAARGTAPRPKTRGPVNAGASRRICWTSGRQPTRWSSRRTPTRATSSTTTDKPLHFSGIYRADFMTGPRAAFSAVGRQIAVPADALLSGSAPPER